MEAEFVEEEAPAAKPTKKEVVEEKPVENDLAGELNAAQNDLGGLENDLAQINEYDEL